MRLVFVLLLGLAACQSAKPNSVRPISELPERYREVWTAYLRDDPAWPGMRAEVDADPELAGFLADNLTREMLRAYGAREFTTLDAQTIGPFERARAELLLRPEVTLPRMVELFAVGNGEASELAGDLLARMGRDSVQPVAALLEREEVRSRQRAAHLLGRLPMLPGEEEALVRGALIEAVASDEDWLVRGAAAESLGLRGSRDRTTREARVALARALGDVDQAVHVRAAEGLARLEDPQAVPVLIHYLRRCMAEPSPAGVMASQKALRALTRTGGASRTPQEWEVLWKEQRRAAVKAGGA